MSLQLLNDSEINGDDGSLSYAAIDSPSYAGAPGLVATPRGSPSPPIAASTIARQKIPHRVISDFETSMEFPSKPQNQYSISIEDDRKGISRRNVGDDTSFGLLPSGAMENCTLYNTAGHQHLGTMDSSRLAIFGVSRLLPPTPDDIASTDVTTNLHTNINGEHVSNSIVHHEYVENPETSPKGSSRPVSQTSYHPDDSIETVIRKGSNQISPQPHLMMFSPEPIDQATTKALEDSLKVTHESVNQVEVEEKYSPSQRENIEEMLNTPNEMEFDFMNASAQDFQNELHLNEEFNDLHLNNSDFINAEEKENHEAYRFIQEEQMHISNSSCHHHQNEWSGYFGVTNDSGKVTDQPKAVLNSILYKEVSPVDPETEDGISNKTSVQMSHVQTSENEQCSETTLSSGCLEDGMNDYFRTGTSRIGISLDDHSIPINEKLTNETRPDFGFGKIKSPKRVPVNMLEPNEIEENDKTVTVENHKSEITNPEGPQESSNLDKDNEMVAITSEVAPMKDSVHASINKIDIEDVEENDNTVNAEHQMQLTSYHEHQHKSSSLQEGNVTKELSLVVPEKADHNLAPTISEPENDQKSFTNLDTTENSKTNPDICIAHENHLPSQHLEKLSDDIPVLSLQQSVQETILEETGVVIDTGTILGILRSATPGHNPKYYASLVIKHMADLDQGIFDQADMVGLIHEPKLQSSQNKKHPCASSISCFLPSFLEDSSEIDVTRDLFDAKSIKAKGSITSNRMQKSSITSELNNDTSIASSVSSKSKNRNPITPNKFKHSSPIKKPPSTKIYTDLKENNSRISNLSERILANKEIRGDRNFKSSYQLEPSSTYKELNGSAMRNKFPIESDKVAMNWFSTRIDVEGESQKIKLQNILETTTLRVRLIIRDSNDFVFRENHVKGFSKPPHFLDIILPPKGMKDVHVIYIPKRSGIYSRGKLILKPQLSGMKNVKASVTLLGYSGCADMRFEYQSQFTKKLENGCLDSMNEQFGEEIKINVKNHGETAGFAKLCAFSSSDFKSSVPKNDLAMKKLVSLNVENREIILNPNDKDAVIKLKLSKSHNSVQPDETIHFVLFYGTEIHRQAFAIANQNHPYTAMAPDLSLHQNFCSFSSSFNFFNEEHASHISIDNITTFYEKLNRIDFQIRFHGSNKTFYKLIPEETFNESRYLMSNYTNPYDSLSFSPVSETEETVSQQVAESVGMSFTSDAKQELEFAVNTPSKQIAILPNPLNRQIHNRDKKTDLKFSVIAASKPRLLKSNSNEVNRMEHTTIQQANNESYQSKRLQTLSRSGVFMDKTELYFPAVRLEESSVIKVTVKNRTKQSVYFTVNQLSAPFTSYHTSVEVKPSFYLNIPIKYCPTLKDGKGPHESFLRLEENVVDGKVLIARLIGRRL